MSADPIAITPSSATTETGARSSIPPEDRQKIAQLAAEFESLLTVNMLRDMRTSGRWMSDDESESGGLGAETFLQTFDLELARYLSMSKGLGLSQQLMEALDRRSSAARTAAADSLPASAADVPAADAPAYEGAPWAAPIASVVTTAGRTGWNGLKLDPPAYGGSGAQWAGFNDGRAMAGGDDQSIKDGFYRWSYGLDFNPAGKSKGEIESFLRSQVAGAREYGLNILDVKEEKILVETAERGAEWVDVVAAAGSANPSEVKWQWLCQTDMGEAGGGAIGTALADLRARPNGQAIVQAVLAEGTSGAQLLSRLQAESSSASVGGPSAALEAAGARQNSARQVSAADLRVPDGDITSPYGWRQDPFTKATTFHRGVDVRAAAGSDVPSAGAGTVVFSGTEGSYGRSIVVEHANGLSTRYAHLSTALVRAGDEVEEGQVLGRVGQTGRATAPHLHFEVIEDGRRVNPEG